VTDRKRSMHLPTKPPLRLLLIEDSDDDAALILRELRAGFDLQAEIVQTKDAFMAALAEAPWDVIVSDYNLPRYNGMDALGDLRARGLDIPFVLVSGTIGEDRAVEVMRAGARDYVLKHQLARLCAAVEREVREARNRAERLRMQERLIFTERLAAAGTIAASVAHEINNPLAVVVANMDLIASELEALPPESRPSAELLEPLCDVREALGRIREIVRDVRLFSRPQEDERRAVDVERVIDSSVRMAQNEIRHRAQLIKEYAGVPLVYVNEARLGQVVLNLIVNAAQAIPDGAANRNVIKVKTRSGEGNQVVFEVSDSGCGIPKENLARIFESFFTTKPEGLGTGLGLAICQRLVAELDGHIDVESTVGVGTLFRVTLPPATAAQSGSIAILSSKPLSTTRARVLVVDDELAIGKALKRTLGQAHDVTPITSGREAVARITRGERFDVIVSDLMMPDFTGVELYEELSKIAPDQAKRMIFLTGGAFTERGRAFLETVPNQKLDKPVEIATLRAAIAIMASAQG
jgi:signal transduction histidine kinase